jgi:hypothetical protein
VTESFAAVEHLLAEHAEIESRLADPAVHADAGRARTLGRRYAELGQVVAAYRAWRDATDDVEAAAELATEDASFAAELPALQETAAAATEKLRRVLVPRDPDDGRDVILEIKAGEGGEESALFAGDLLRMYLRYAERRGWKTEIIEATDSDLGGYKDVQVAVKARAGATDPADGVWADACDHQAQEKFGLIAQPVMRLLSEGPGGHEAVSRVPLDGRDDASDLVHDQVVDSDVLDRVWEPALELRDRHRLRQLRGAQGVERLEAGDEVGEEIVSGCPGDRDGPVPRDELAGRNSGRVAARPVERVAPAARTLDSLDESMVPVGRPAVDDEPVLVQDPREELAHLRGVGRELLDGVELVELGVVTVKLDHSADSMSQRLHARDGDRGAHHLVLNASVGERLLDQPIEVGRHDHPDRATAHELGDRLVRRTRHLLPRFAILVARLEEPGK